MHRRLVVLVVGCGMLNGCVAVVAPIVAAGALGGKQVIGRKGGRSDAPQPVPASLPEPPPQAVTAPTAPAAEAPPLAVAAPPADAPTPATHGWRSMVTYVADAVQAKTRPEDSAVLAPGSTDAVPRFLPCGAKPFAVIVDAEGTVLPRIEAPRGTSVRTDEALRSFGDLRFGQVVVIFTSGRPPAEIAATEIAIERAGLGPAMQGRELLSAADGSASLTKAALRVAVANQYCVLALIGDQPQDFVDARSAEDWPAATVSRWGAGWFHLPAQTAP
jgi:hypothetical protein